MHAMPRLSSHFSLVAALALCLILAAPTLAQDGHRELLGDSDPAWVDSWEHEIENQIDMLVAAYNLDPDAEAALRAEMLARMVQQQEYDKKMQEELNALAAKINDAGIDPSNEDAPEVQLLNERFTALTHGMPLSEKQTSVWLESRLPPERAREGRQRLEELITRRVQVHMVDGQDLEASAGKKTMLTREARDMTAQQDAYHVRPVAPGDLGEIADAETRRANARRLSEPSRPKRASEKPGYVAPADVPEYVPPPVRTPPPAPQSAAPQGSSPAAPPVSPPPPRPVVKQPEAQPPQSPAQPPPPPLAPAPPLDDWEKHMQATANKYGFDAGQLTNARSILSDLRRRAYQYQASRAEDFARAELMTDAKARAEQLKNLNKPIDALFEELKQRLESLPTQHQRQKATQPAKK